MTLTRTQQVRLLAALLAAMAVLILYRVLSSEAPRTQPLVFTKGMTVSSPVRKGLTAPRSGSDPVMVMLERRVDSYPGVARDIFHLAPESGPDQQPKKKTDLRSVPAPTVTLPTPTVIVKSQEEVAADLARADLSQFRFLGYLTDKDSSLFLSKDGELFIAKSGDTLLKNYRIKSAGKDHVILVDAATKVEVRIELSGSADGKAK